jgi:membrane protease YdiL (CAAX protease family)
MFGIVRERPGSLYPAMASHATFNLVMNVAIFAALWPAG